MVNAPVDAAVAVGREAMARGFRSMGEYARRLIYLGAQLDNPALARKLEKAFSEYYRPGLSVQVVVLVTWGGLVQHDVRRVTGRRSCGTCAGKGRRRHENGHRQSKIGKW